MASKSRKSLIHSDEAKPRRMTIMADAIEMNDVLELIGFGKAQIRLMIVCGLLIMHQAAEMMGMGAISLAIKCDFEIYGQWQVFAIRTSAFYGPVFTAYLWGHLSDRFGRKSVLTVSVCAVFSFNLCSVLMPNFWSFLFIRIVLGFFVAGSIGSTATYLYEFFCKGHRVHAVIYLSMATGIGMSYPSFLGTLIIPGEWHVVIHKDFMLGPWRLMLLCFSLPGVLGFIGLCFLPESPCFLLVDGKGNDSMQVLTWMCKTNRNIDLEEAGIDRLSQLLMPNDISTSLWDHFPYDMIPLFYPPYRKKFIISIMIFFNLYLIAQGLGLSLADMRDRNDTNLKAVNGTFCVTTVLKPQHDPELDSFVCFDTFVTFNDSSYLGLHFAICYFIVFFASLRCPRVWVFCIPLVLTSFLCIFMHYTYKTRWVSQLLNTLVAVPSVVTAIHGNAVMENVPTYLRGKAMCLCGMAGRLGVIIGNKIITILFDEYCNAMFFFFACIILICAALGFYNTYYSK